MSERLRRGEEDKLELDFGPFHLVITQRPFPSLAPREEPKTKSPKEKKEHPKF